jgi:hypothetical protein
MAAQADQNKPGGIMTTKEITNLKRYLAKLEVEHFRCHAAELAERLEVAEENARYEREVAESWRENAFDLMEQMMDDGQQLGLTKSGEVVAVSIEPKNRLKALLIDTTLDQINALEPLFNEQKERGGAILAQIWKDGIRATLVSKEMQAQIVQITGADQSKAYTSASAAHLDAEDR